MKNFLEEYELSHEIVGEGIPVLMIHGYCLDRNVMKGSFEPIFLRRNNFQRIYIDLPGMGKSKSDKFICNVDIMFEVINNLLKKIIKDKNFVVIGESYGGYIARAFVKKFSNKIIGICLVCPVIYPLLKDRILPEHLLTKVDLEVFEDIPKSEKLQYIESHTVINKITWEKYKKYLMNSLNRYDESYLLNFRKNGYAFSFNVDNLEKAFNKPALFLAGRQDSIVGYEDIFNLLQNYKRATLSIIDKSGHNVQFEQEELFNSLVYEWIDRIEEDL